MLTPEEIEAQIRADHPEFRISEGEDVVIISPETDAQAYEAMVAERVAWRIDRQDQDAATAADETQAAQVKLRYDALKAGTATAKQTQEVVAHLLRREYRDLAP